MRQSLPCLLLFLAIGNLASAQIVQLGSISPAGRSAIRTAMAAGVPPVPEQIDDKAKSRFERADTTVAFAALAARYASEDAEREGLVQLFESAVAKYDEAAAGSGLGNDMAGALAMLLLVRERLATGKDLPEGTDQKIARQLQAVLDTAAIAGLADRDKQAVFEWAIGTSALLLTLQQQVAQSGGDPEHKLAAAVDDMIGDAFGVPAKQFILGADGLQPTRVATLAVASRDFVQLAAVSVAGHAAVRAALGRGVLPPPAAAKAHAASRFRRAAAPVAVARIAAAYDRQEGARRGVAMALFQRMLTGFAARLSEEDRRDDLASGIAVLIAARHQLATGTDLDYAITQRITLQVQAALDTPAVRTLSDSDKQAVQEWALCTTAMLMWRQQQQPEPAARRRLLAAADELLGSLFTIGGERLGVSAAGLAIADDATAATAPRPAGSFAFTTTRFDDGWVATEGQEGVYLRKGDTTVLLHFGVAYTDATRNLEEQARVLHFWNTLVSPRHRVASISIRPATTGIDRVYFGDGDGTEIATGKPVHVALMITSQNGQARCTEIVTPDAAALTAQFASDEAMRHLSDYNKFNVGANDLPGIWEESASIYSQYYYRDTGNSAGMRGSSTYTKFSFQQDGAYQFEYAGVSDQLGVHTDKQRGRFAVGDWDVTITDSDGKQQQYHARFEAIRGGRILHLQNKQASGLQYHLLKRD